MKKLVERPYHRFNVPCYETLKIQTWNNNKQLITESFYLAIICQFQLIILVKKSENLHFDGLLLSKAYKVVGEKVQKSYVSWFLVPKMTWRIWWILMWAESSLKICTLICYFCWKYIMLAPKNSTEELCVITLKNDVKFEEKLTCALKNDMRNLANFDPTFESLKICTLMGSFWLKYIMFELKNYRGVTRYYTEDRWKLWREIDLWFHKWHEEFGEFHRSTQKS